MRSPIFILCVVLMLVSTGRAADVIRFAQSYEEVLQAGLRVDFKKYSEGVYIRLRQVDRDKVRPDWQRAHYTYHVPSRKLYRDYEFGVSQSGKPISTLFAVGEKDIPHVAIIVGEIADDDKALAGKKYIAARMADLVKWSLPKDEFPDR